MQAVLKIEKSIYTINHINRAKEKNSTYEQERSKDVHS